MYIFSFFLSERAGEEGKRQFLQEIDLMNEIGSHRNVLSMLGYWIKSEPIMIIMEYVPHGDLLQWLRNKRQQVSIFLHFMLTHMLGSPAFQVDICRYDVTSYLFFRMALQYTGKCSSKFLHNVKKYLPNDYFH